MAQRLSEDHISPITRERLNLKDNSLVGGGSQEAKKQNHRRTSVDIPPPATANSSISRSKRAAMRSKSTDVQQQDTAAVTEKLDKVKEQLLHSQQLLMKTFVPQEKAAKQSLDSIEEESQIDDKATATRRDFDEDSNDLSEAKNDCSSTGTLFVKKRVRVQSPSDPLAKIKDLVRSNSREDITKNSRASRSSASQDREPTAAVTPSEAAKGPKNEGSTEVAASSSNSGGGGQESSGGTRSNNRQSRSNSSSSSRNKKNNNNTPQNPAASPNTTKLEDVSLNEENLVDGLRVLVRIEGHFYPGRLNAINPPDIYGVLLDNERGFKPHIYAREELLKNVIRDVRVSGGDNTVPLGTRVCAYWSTKYVYLHPGTVVPREPDSELPAK